MSQELTPDAILAWVRLGSVLTELGFDAAMKIKNAFYYDLTAQQMDQIINAVMDDARRRKALADADAQGPQ